MPSGVGSRKQAYRMIWRGAEVERALDAATKAGINETTEACVEVAQGYAPVDTGALRDDIAAKPAAQSGTRITARWGNWLVTYAWFQEEGTYKIVAKHYLRRAMEEEYPHTGERIKAHLNKVHSNYRWKK